MGGMGRLRSYLLRYWRRYFLGIVCLFLTVSLVMWIPWLMRAAVKVIEEGGTLWDVRYYALLIGVAGVLQGIVRTFSRAFIFNAGRDIEYDIRNDLFAHLQKLPVGFYHSQRTGDLMSRVINDISAVRSLLGPGMLNFVNAPAYYLYGIVLMFSIDVRLTLVALLPFPLLMYAVRRFRGKVLKSSLSVQRQMAELSSHIQENLSGMHVVKAYTQEEHQIRDFVRLNHDFQEKNMELASLRGRIGPVMQGISGITVLLVIAYGGLRVIRGDLLIADIVAFIAYLHVLAWPTAAFGWMLSLIERGRAAMERLEEIFKAEPEIANPAAPLGMPASREGIEFRNVWFSHEAKINGQAILKEIDVVVPRGRTLGIVGRTGAGKSTMAQLIPRLFDVSSGEIRIGGKDIRSLS
ncbi:MAG TPA: ABC transporter transmembrane domain-containing protein, partial [Candidatus Binatia bacterium]|nr:ABC transporter transmembrane domain-containing protein [Candidatus Binatia bacterium]